MEDPTPLEKLIGANLKRLRVKNRLSLQELANKLALSKSQIWNYEAGLAPLNAHRLPEIADLLDCGVMEFYKGAEYLMAGNSILVEIPSNYESDILINFRKVKQDFQPHIANLFAEVCKNFQSIK